MIGDHPRSTAYSALLALNRVAYRSSTRGNPSMPDYALYAVSGWWRRVDAFDRTPEDSDWYAIVRQRR